jgi:hypothetical protein
MGKRTAIYLSGESRSARKWAYQQQAAVTRPAIEWTIAVL